MGDTLGVVHATNCQPDVGSMPYNSNHAGVTMKRKRDRVFLILITVGCCLFFATGYGWSTQDATAGLLVRLQMTEDYEGVRHLEFLFFRDGLVVTKTVQGNAATYWRGTLALDELNRFRSALNQYHVGVIPADHCDTASPLPNAAPFEGTLTWFGKNNRQNYMTFGSAGAEECPADLTDLFYTIYNLAVKYTDVVTTLP